MNPRTDLAAKPGAVRRDRANVFISGHSLTDQPLPDFLAQVADSLGTPMRWNRQYVTGSTLKERTRGMNAKDSTWGGYLAGANRQGDGMNVLAELRQPTTIGGERYDTLLITEQNGLLWSLFNNDSVRYLRHFHDRFIEGNPKGQTFFYEPWNGLNSQDDPRRWIEFERAASPVWQCIATRINVSLVAEGRNDRIATMPGGWMMAALVERATQGTGLPGISGATVRETLDRLFSDNVHLTRLGSYYLALVTYATLYGHPPFGAGAPDGVSEAQANLLQQFAWDALSEYRANNRPLDLASCRRILADGFIWQFQSYSREIAPAQQSKLRGYWRLMRNTLSDHWQVRRNNASNPLYFDAATDKDYWFPSP